MMEKLWGPRSDAVRDSDAAPVQQETRGEIDVDILTEAPAPARGSADGVAPLDPALHALRSEVATLRSDIEARLLTPADLAEVRADARDELLQQLPLVLGEAAKHADEQAAMVRDGLQHQLDDVAEKVAEARESWSTDPVSRGDFDALQMELRNVVSRQMAAAQTQLQRSVGLLDAAIADARAQIAQRLHEMAQLVSTEAAAAADGRLRRVAVGVASAHTGLRDLQERVREIGATVDALQRRPPAS